MRLPAPGITEGEHVFFAVEESTIEQGLHLSCGLCWQPLQIKVLQRFFEWKLGIPQQTHDAVLAPLLAFPFSQIQEILFVAQSFPLRLSGFFLKALPDGRL